MTIQYQDPKANCAVARSTEHECSTLGTNTCVWKDHKGNIYNLSSLKDESDFTVKNGEYGFWYSYHPCRWLRLNGACNRSSKAALCKWVPYLSDLNDFSSEALGKGKPECYFNPLRLEYSPEERFVGLKTTVRLFCNKNRTKGKLRVKKEDANWIFSLGHRCACENVCALNKEEKVPSTTPTRPSNTDMDLTVVIACAGTVTFLALLSHCFRGRGNNDNNEQRPLLNNGLDRPRIEVINNMIK